MGSIQNDLDGKLKNLVEGNNFEILILALSNSLSKYSHFFRTMIYPDILKVMFYNKKADPKNPIDQFKRYKKNIEIIEGICAKFEITPIFILQPLLLTKTKPSPEEKILINTRYSNELATYTNRFYNEWKTNFNMRSNFLDLSGIMDSTASMVYYDFGHLQNSQSNSVIARSIANKILKLLNESEID